MYPTPEDILVRETGTLTVPGEPPNRAPEARFDELVAITGEQTDIDVFANDSDLDGDVLQMESHQTVSDQGGAVRCPGVMDQPGNGICRYQSLPGFTGFDVFTYTVGDGSGLTDVGYVFVEVVEKALEPEAKSVPAPESWELRPMTLDETAFTITGWWLDTAGEPHIIENWANWAIRNFPQFSLDGKSRNGSQFTIRLEDAGPVIFTFHNADGVEVDRTAEVNPRNYPYGELTFKPDADSRQWDWSTYGGADAPAPPAPAPFRWLVSTREGSRNLGIKIFDVRENGELRVEILRHWCLGADVSSGATQRIGDVLKWWTGLKAGRNEWMTARYLGSGVAEVKFYWNYTLIAETSAMVPPNEPPPDNPP
jgi:hypothetical protein